MVKKEAPKYHPKEERLNIVTHAFGFILSLLALVLLISKSSLIGSPKHIISFSIFGASLIVLYAASTLYHSAKSPRFRYWLNIADHSSIYILIAGTYTPFALITLGKSNGWLIFGIVWSIAVVGIIFKLFFIGKFEILSTIMYVAMGWLVVFDIKPLLNNLPLAGVIWLFAGGLFYTIGAIIFEIDRINFNHAIFHFLVLAGSFCHFISIFFFVLPEK